MRLAAALSQEELAARAGLSTQAISALERKIRRAPYCHTLDAFAAALSLDAADRAALISAARAALGDAAFTAAHTAGDALDFAAVTDEATARAG